MRKLARPFVKPFEAEDFNGQTGLRIAQLMRDGKAVEVIETLLPKAQWVKYIHEVPELVFEVPVPRTPATVEAFAAGQPVVLRSPEDPASAAYIALAEALIRRAE